MRGMRGTTGMILFHVCGPFAKFKKLECGVFLLLYGSFYVIFLLIFGHGGGVLACLDRSFAVGTVFFSQDTLPIISQG